MKRKETARRPGQEASFIHGPALNVVVYRNPGPDDDAIDEEAIESHSSCNSRGPITTIVATIESWPAG